MSPKPEPVIWSYDTGQCIPYFDRCQLTIIWMSNIKDVCCKPRLPCLSPLAGKLAAMVHNVLVGCMHQRSITVTMLLIFFLSGDVFGSKDYFYGLGIFFDTYSNHNGEHQVS